MKEEPTENRKFTGSDDPFTAEQINNLLNSKEFADVQKNRIKDLVDNTIDPRVEAYGRAKQIVQSIDLIRAGKDGDLLADILKCRFAGYSHKKIAKVLMKSERDLPYFTSLEKAIKFVEEKEKEGFYKVKVALSNKSRIIIP